jgi:hypothetical protein
MKIEDAQCSELLLYVLYANAVRESSGLTQTLCFFVHGTSELFCVFAREHVGYGRGQPMEAVTPISGYDVYSAKESLG